MAVPTFGNTTYGDAANTPVPIKSYRCKSTATDLSKKSHTHLCKIGIDHDEDHACICGREWPHADDVAGRAAA